MTRQHRCRIPRFWFLDRQPRFSLFLQIMNAQRRQTKRSVQELSAYANVREHPAVFLLLTEPLALKHVFRLRSALGDDTFQDLDIVIHSSGGDIHAAYQIVELLRLHTERLHACVPFYAKSAATLLCLGSDDIFVDELAQLGPLDTQIYEERKGGGGEFTSALNPFKALEQLQSFSLETLDVAVRMIAMRSNMDLDECLKHAIEFVRGTTGPLFTQIKPEKLGEYNRALAVGTEYGERLLRRFTTWDDKKRTQVLEKLVHGYPSHEYIIDYHELKEIGFSVSMFSEPERVAVRNLFKILDSSAIVELVLPVEGKSRDRQSADQEDAES